MKKSPLRYVIAAGIALLASSCVLYMFPGGSGPWDFDDSSSLPSGFTTTGSYVWTIDTTTSADSGSNSARSGSPTYAGGSSSMEVDIDSLTEDADIHFAYKVSGSGSDYLTFSINGTTVATYWGTGSTPSYWSYDDIYDSSAIDEYGTNTLKWTYYRGSSSATASNCAWIDSISIDGM